LPKIFFDPIEPFKPQAGGDYLYGIIASWGVSDDLVNWYAPIGIQPTKLPCSMSEIVEPAQCVHLVETFDWLVNQGFPGNDIALSPFENSGMGALNTLDAPYAASYRKTTKAQPADPRGLNITAFCDGHVKATVASRLQHSAELWSRSNTTQWP
jgi:prepilin-type processing-associated H-X9-DG protein